MNEYKFFQRAHFFNDAEQSRLSTHDQLLGGHRVRTIITSDGASDGMIIEARARNLRPRGAPLRARRRLQLASVWLGCVLKG